MAIVFLALGSNLGDRAATLGAAVRRIRAEPGWRFLGCSSWYETAAVGGPSGQGAYLNGVAAIETTHSPERVLETLLLIERRHGRIRTLKDAPRTLDLDILLYDREVLRSERLEIPHPRLHERTFVLAPFVELAQRLGVQPVHPVFGTSIADMLAPLLLAGHEQPHIWHEPPTRESTLTGMRALVTGSTIGIGAAIAALFEQHGAQVIRHGRSNPGFANFIAADLRNSHDLERLVEECWGSGLDILVCNAGADVLTGTAASSSFDDKLDVLLEVDVKSTIRLGRGLGARMKERGRGAILTMGWDQAESGMAGDSGQFFAAAKGAVMAFTRSLALSLAPEVRVNCLAPGWIRTAWGESASEEWQERVRRETPLGIWGLPEDVAEAALRLVSPAAAYQTGQIVRVNGGAVR